LRLLPLVLLLLPYCCTGRRKSGHVGRVEADDDDDDEEDDAVVLSVCD
jgi:hypothetical protein